MRSKLNWHHDSSSKTDAKFFPWTHWVFVAALALGTDSMLHAQGRPAAPVVVAPVLRQDVRASQQFVGSVMPEKHAVIGSAVDGRVVEFPAKEGERVREKGTLAVLLTETIKLELTTAEAELDLRSQELQELRNGTRPEEKQQAKALKEAAQASYDFAKKRFDRVQQLAERGNVVSQETYEEAQSDFTNAQQMLNDRTAAYDLAMKGPRPEKVAQALARLNMQQAVVQKLQDQIRKHTIISRFAGYVTAEHTEIGQWVKRGDPVAEVVALDQVDVVVNVLESHIPHVRKGDSVRVSVPAVPSRVFTGTVNQIVPQGDLRSRTFPVKIRVKNLIEDEQPLLKAGMLARAFLPIGTTHEATIVPKDSIVLGGRQPTVFVVGDGSVDATSAVKAVPVTLGSAYGSFVEVQGELENGMFVVVLGNERLRPQTEVVVTKQLSAEEAGAPQPISESQPSQSAQQTPKSTAESKRTAEPLPAPAAPRLPSRDE